MKSVRPLTKGLPYALIITAIFLLMQSSLMAATITWTAGNSNWNNAANWDLGIPTAADHVVIPSGRAKIPFGYTAYASSIDIQGDVWIRNNATLLLANASQHPSVQLTGRITIDGHLNIENSIKTIGIFQTGTAFHCEGLARIRANGSMNIHTTDYQGIVVQASGNFINHGEVTMDDIDGVGIFNTGTFNNHGDMEIFAGPFNNQSAIVNGDTFTNHLTGYIHAEGGRNYTVLNWANALYSNYGVTDIKFPYYNGFDNSGELINYSDGLLSITTAGQHGIHNKSTGSFYNYGYTNTTGLDIGLINESILNNPGTIITSGLDFDLEDDAGATIENTGNLIFSSTTDNLSLYGNLNNDGGLVLLSGKAILNAGSVFDNHGVLVSEYTFAHDQSATAQLNNYGILEDPNESFISINNQQVVAKPLTGVMQNGVLFSDPLEVVSLSNVTVNGWYENSLGPSIGTYDAVNNTLTPNVNAIGLKSIQAKITINSTGIIRYVAIDLDTPVAAMVNPENDIIIDAPKFKTTSTNNELEVYPNPTIGEINLHGSILQNDAIQILVLNQLGQVVMEKKGYGAEALQFQLPNHLANGNYRVVCLQQGKLVSAKNILLNKD